MKPAPGSRKAKEVVTIAPEAMVHEAAELLLKHRVGCLPVLEPGGLIGIGTTSDLLRAVVGPCRRAADRPGAMAAASLSPTSRVGARR